MRSAPSARLTASTETGRLTESGWTVSGKATVLRSGNTAISGGSGGVVGVMSAMKLEERLQVFHSKRRSRVKRHRTIVALRGCRAGRKGKREKGKGQRACFVFPFAF